MFERLKGDKGRPEVIQLLLRQELVERKMERAEYLFDNGVLKVYEPGEALIRLRDEASSVFFILKGEVTIYIGRHTLVASFGSDNHVGEIAALQVATRSANVDAIGAVIALELPKDFFTSFLKRFPDASFALAMDFARRLESRNSSVKKPGKKHRIFAISSLEALDIATSGVRGFMGDPHFDFYPWPVETFKTGSYLLEDLEAELGIADFAVAIAQDDDIGESRGTRKAVPRDNVIFELGLFMGRLGRKRTILMVPEGKDVKLPSDLRGISIIEYPKNVSTDKHATMNTWLQVKDHFQEQLS